MTVTVVCDEWERAMASELSNGGRWITWRGIQMEQHKLYTEEGGWE